MATASTPPATSPDPARSGAGGLGLRFFSPDVTPAHRRRRWIFVAVCSVAASMILWPVYPFFAHPKPLILGLPLSLVWVLAALGLVFGALLWLFLGEPTDTED